MKRTLLVACLLSGAARLTAQTPAQTPAPMAAPLPVSAAQTVTVTTSVEPLPLADPDRSVMLFDLADPAKLPLYNSPEDYLRLDTALNLQERAPNGVQADISVRGTTFEQTLVLVDGLRLNDPESGHLNLNLPVPLDAISRIDVLHGSGSTFYGSDAIGGAVNFITAPPTRSTVELKLGGGTYNETEQHLKAAFLNVPQSLLTSEQLTASRDTSDGFYYQTPGGAYEDDRGYHATSVASDTFLHTPAGTTEVLLGMNDDPFGANLYYGNYDSKERMKSWFASIRQELAHDTAADFAYDRHTDEFFLLAANPGYYENNHIATGWQADLRHTSHPARNVELAYGLEEVGDSIFSNNLGHHARNQSAGYLNLSMRALKRLSVSAGAREEVYAGPASVFSPSVALGYMLAPSLRAHAAYGHGFRLPTYTDLYYQQAGFILGNPSLKPETSQSYEGGLDYTRTRLHASVTGFQLRQSNAIDYVKFTPNAAWQALNIGVVNYTGVESSASFAVDSTQHLDLGYTFIHANQPPPGIISEYAYNFASQNASIGYSAVIAKQVSARTQLGVVQKIGQTPYPLWSVAFARSRGLVRPYVRLDNLSNTLYFEVPGPPMVPMPGRTVTGGIVVTWAPSH